MGRKRKTDRTEIASPMSISVPKSLRTRMDNTADEANWSEVCRKAIEGELTRLVAKKNALASRDDAVKRILASKQEQYDVLHDLGLKDGAAWVLSRASFDELKLFARRFRGLSTTEDWEQFEESWEDTQKQEGVIFLCDFFLRHLDKARFYDRATAPEDRIQFWPSSDTKSHDRKKIPYLRGFRDGAIATWDDLKDDVF